LSGTGISIIPGGKLPILGLPGIPERNSYRNSWKEFLKGTPERNF
jgi:hypothetical protein